MSELTFLSTLVLNDLKELGIKPKGKKPKVVKNTFGNRLFRQRLEHLRLTDAFLANGTVVQVPQFVTEACSYILENCETEGIFRKAGSAAKQREIRTCLEGGQPLGKSHSVIDIANIVSYFFRELPDPLIPQYLHETFERCLLVREPNHIRSIQLACLLTSPLNVNTLAYFMQFLQTISRHVSYNKMSAENLAIVIAPSVMPYRDINCVRLKTHIKLVEFLIKNANIIGTIPPNIREKLQSTSKEFLLNPLQNRKSCGSTIKNKMQRNQIFSGLKIIVGSSNNKTEHVNLKPSYNRNAGHSTKLPQNNKPKQTDTPSKLNSTTQHFPESLKEFKVKKNKNMRLTLNSEVNKGSINTTSYPITINSTNRRWSLMSAGWSKYKKKDLTEKENTICQNEQLLPTPVKNNLYVDSCISKSEYEAITERVTSMETQILQTILPNDFKTKSSITNFERNNEKCVKSKRHPQKRVDGNYKQSPTKIKILHKTQIPTRIIRHKTWHLNSASKLPVNLPIIKNDSTETVVITDVSTPKHTMTHKQIIDSEWRSADTFFKNEHNKRSPLIKVKDHHNTQNRNSQVSKNPNSPSNGSIRNITENINTRRRPTKSLCLGSAMHAFDEDKTRESIARLRTENAGMVLAKKKIFDDINSCCA